MKKVSFMESKLVGGEWTPKYGSADFNNIIKKLTTKGVILESATVCQVIANAAGSVKALVGSAVMGDGSIVEISAEPEVVVLASVTLKNYIYFQRDVANNTINLMATLTAPTGDFVNLAEVTGALIVDKREYSAFKVTNGLGNGYFVKKH